MNVIFIFAPIYASLKHTINSLRDQFISVFEDGFDRVLWYLASVCSFGIIKKLVAAFHYIYHYHQLSIRQLLMTAQKKKKRICHVIEYVISKFHWLLTSKLEHQFFLRKWKEVEDRRFRENCINHSVWISFLNKKTKI